MIAEKDVMDVRRCVIVGGAEIRTYDRVRQYFRPDDFFIYCDCGLRHQEALRAEPDLIVGDFDSHEKPETDRLRRMIRTRCLRPRRPCAEGSTNFCW